MGTGGVALASVGLALLFLLPGTDGLHQGLAFEPIANVVGGLVIGVGMVVARSCVSGLFYKLGSGMLGALIGLAGWAAGELLARQLTLPGPTVLPGGEAATLPGVLGLPRLQVAALLLTSVAVALWRRPAGSRLASGPRASAPGGLLLFHGGDRPLDPCLVLRFTCLVIDLLGQTDLKQGSKNRHVMPPRGLPLEASPVPNGRRLVRSGAGHSHAAPSTAPLLTRSATDLAG